MWLKMMDVTLIDLEWPWQSMGQLGFSMGYHGERNASCTVPTSMGDLDGKGELRGRREILETFPLRRVKEGWYVLGVKGTHQPQNEGIYEWKSWLITKGHYNPGIPYSDYLLCSIFWYSTLIRNPRQTACVLVMIWASFSSLISSRRPRRPALKNT